MASGSDIASSGSGPTTPSDQLLSDEEVQATRPNRQIVWVTKDQTTFRIDVQVFCATNELDITKNSCTVCHYQDQWHYIQWSKNKKRFRLGRAVPEFSEYDLEHETPSEKNWESDKELDSTEEDDEPILDITNQSIRATPVPLSVTSPARTMSTTAVTTTTTHATMASSTQPPPAPVAAPTLTSSTDVQALFNNALCRQGGGGSGPPGSSPPGGAPGGGPPAPGPLGAGPNAALQPVAVAGDIKMMGQPPPVFYGDRTKADHFVDQVKGYLRLNRDVTGFNSPMKKMAFMLSHIQGEETNAWKRDMGNLLDGLDPVADNIPLLWDQFLNEFRTQFQDTQRENRARAQIENHRMRFPDIDQYISAFEELARTAGYTQGDEATTHYFVKGLSPSVMIDVYKPPMPQTYAEIKQRAIDSTRSRMLIDDILGKRSPGRGRGQPPRFGTFGCNQQQNRPFFQQPRQQSGSVQSQQQYNSTNAPRWMNNTPVPMDLSRTRAPTWRGRGRGGNAFG